MWNFIYIREAIILIYLHRVDECFESKHTSNVSPVKIKMMFKPYLLEGVILYSVEGQSV